MIMLLHNKAEFLFKMKCTKHGVFYCTVLTLTIKVKGDEQAKQNKQ